MADTRATLRIVVTADTGQIGRVVEIGDAPVFFGRGEGDVVLADPSVSRRHAVVRRLAIGFEIEDLGSSNGTWIGDRRVAKELLRNGDQFRLGQAVVEFRLEAAAEPEARPEPKP